MGWTQKRRSKVYGKGMFSLNISGSTLCSIEHIRIYYIESKTYQTHFSRLKTDMCSSGSHILGATHLPVSLWLVLGVRRGLKKIEGIRQKAKMSMAMRLLILLCEKGHLINKAIKLLNSLLLVLSACKL